MGAPDRSPATSNSMQRVKVYRLNDDGKWDDQGTGHVTVDYLERSEELGLCVVDEEDSETLLLHRISSDDIYRKQEDTIISWRDPEYSTELALSFQETTGCSYIWDHICNAQRNLHFNSLNNDTFHSMNSELRELPAIELSTLPLILKVVTESGITDQMRLMELIVANQDFFKKLMDIFHICEDLENLDGLHMIYKIVRGIIMLNSSQIFEKIFGDELIMDIIGSLEYDPEVDHVQHHRNFLKEHVIFKEAIPIKDPLVLSKIHQTYRIGYLKDVVLARVLDESTIANLNSIIHANNALVVSLLKDDNTFIQELFVKLKLPTTSEVSKKNLVHFLHEFCSLSKNLQMVQQLRLFRDLMNEGIFDVIADVLQSPDKKFVLTGTDILILFLNQDPNLLRSYVVRKEGIPLLGLLVEGLITDFGEEMHCQFFEILRCLLDSYSLSGAAQREAVVEIFYENHLGKLIDVIAVSCPSEGLHTLSNKIGHSSVLKNQSIVKPEILSNLCELLCFCVLHHPYKIKSNFLVNNVIDKVLLLTRRKEKCLVVAAVRFVRTILSRHDDDLVNHFIKNNLLKPIIDAFIANGNRYNLLNSAVLDLFEYICKENLKSLFKYIVGSFWNQLVQFEYLATIQSLKVKYEQCLEDFSTRGTTTNVLDPRKRIEERALEKEEEDYFNGESDEEDTATASVSNVQKSQSLPVLCNGVAASYPPRSPQPGGGLVDYDDEEDDENYRPPPRKQSETVDEDEGSLHTLRLKRRPVHKDKESEKAKKLRLGRNPKMSNGVFAALCSTLSHTVLPDKVTAISQQPKPHLIDPNNCSDHESPKGQDQNALRTATDSNSSLDEENHTEKPPISSKKCSDQLLNPSENRQLNGEDCSLIPPNSSPEMTVNGS
ncbi:serine/threonine-protein phosphatase 4 regulatory subunit 3A-like isoform X1 [Cucurbita pepo subsp. pepo]|uniref:serine/threonine-protein phosphatase 4 regulatory subunit 3A-like isoform X1 n=1 Tax=Cucurbita pepo subsp. pepo TaxID=3664 RepID=UPI000C9D788E|nr:serine/threonine-protein phosphatase 4 regulatory subunit 3A-like isoform X1 [Cucurbita pepo subsp. pepo]